MAAFSLITWDDEPAKCDRTRATTRSKACVPDTPVLKRPSSATCTITKRPAAAPSSSTSQEPKRSRYAGKIGQPLATARRIGYASDCSGIDGGSFALRYMGVDFDHLFASEVHLPYRRVLEATHPDVGTVFSDMTTRKPCELRPFRGSVTCYTSGFPMSALFANWIEGRRWRRPRRCGMARGVSNQRASARHLRARERQGVRRRPQVPDAVYRHSCQIESHWWQVVQCGLESVGLTQLRRSGSQGAPLLRGCAP